MANNCLVTKLKGVVDNDNIPKLGVINLVCSVIAGYPGINADTANTVLLKFDGATVGGSTERYAPVGTGNLTLTRDSGATIVNVKASPKYNLTRISDFYPVGGLKDLAYCKITEIGGVLTRVDDALREVVAVVDIDELAEWKDKSILKTILCNNVGGQYSKRDFYKGNISTLAAFTNLEMLVLTVANVTGNISTLGPCTKLTTMKLHYTLCTGSIESFVQAQRSNGRTTESTGITVNIGNSQLTFNGGSVTGENTLTWTENTITLGGVTVDA